MTAPIILASGSPIRARLLRQAGVAFDVQVPKIDESALRDSLLADGAKPRDIADSLAEMKALRVSQRYPGRLVLGSDQVLVFEDELITKVADHLAARNLLQRLSGKSHDLLTAAVVVEDGRPVWRHIEKVTLRMRSLSPAFIDEYLDQAWPEVAGCVGCYMLEAEGIRLFSGLTGDFHSGLGLPLLHVLSYLAVRGKVAS